MNNVFPHESTDCANLPKTIALIGKYHSQDIAESIRMLARYLHERGMTVLIEEETARNVVSQLDLRSWASGSFAWLGAHADMAIVAGGDGTMLNAARQLARYRVPLVGVNQGRLGFMTDISRNDMLAAMDDLLDGKFVPETRMLLEAEVLRDERPVGAPHLALNDVVVDKGAIGRMIEFELFVDSEFIYHLRADGLIVATSTGSTAYALSANGPILHPQVSAIALVPLCPHALTNRPILVGDRNEIEIRIVHGTDSRVHFDGQVTVDLTNGDCVRIRRSEYSICLLHPPGHSYFAMLRQKLHWSERPKEH
ncbi:NAD kinase [Candidatus Accumulibacter phosphatis]|jgi:NAD+ kinase|uniref:NAD kinase n=1 Tax=Candidatus Accumulibacter phosphatis TaxID=327160 RepID=A0ABX1TW47_9PROT|nr:MULTISPECIES: NAD kinase [Candidatus Accumulibacter]NMQ28441.1 NAD kinase [Candidatus Accumulibacter phosphatis]